MKRVSGYTQRSHSDGFTLVELLIVIVIIAVLAAITLVSYNGIQKRAHASALSSDLSHAAKKLEVANVNNGEYPDTLPSDIKPSDGNVLQLTQVDDGEPYCINGYGKSNLKMSFSAGNGLDNSKLCPGPPIGDPAGGNTPGTKPGDVIAMPAKDWSVSSGLSISGDEVRASGSGYADSKLIYVKGTKHLRFKASAFDSQASSECKPGSCFYVSSYYYGADSSTQVNNSDGYDENGSADDISLNKWNDFSWYITTGPDVHYIEITLRSDPSNYTSKHIKYKNMRLEVVD